MSLVKLLPQLVLSVDQDFIKILKLERVQQRVLTLTLQLPPLHLSALNVLQPAKNVLQ